MAGQLVADAERAEHPDLEVQAKLLWEGLEQDDSSLFFEALNDLWLTCDG